MRKREDIVGKPCLKLITSQSVDGSLMKDFGLYPHRVLSSTCVAV
jgi:hypothetical protein